MKYQATGENSGPDLHFTSHSRIDRADLVSAAARLKWQSIPAYHKFSHVRSRLSRPTPAEQKEDTVVVVVVVVVEVAVVVVVVVVVRGREEEETNRRRTRGEQEKNKRREQQENNKRRANKEDEGDQGYSLGRPHPPY